MRPTAMLAVLLPIAASPGLARVSTPTTLAAAAAAYDRAQIQGDGPALVRLLASDYLLVNGNGSVQDKPAFIHDLTDPSYHLNPYRVLRPVSRVWTGGAVMGGVVRLAGSQGGAPFDICIRFADVWSFRDNRWQVAFTQVSRAEATACAAA